MKKWFFLAICMLIPVLLAAQSNGDYRTRTGGNWNANGTWQVYSGGWSNCGPGDYPGASAGAGLVTIRDNHNVTLNINPPNSIGELTIASGNRNTRLTYNAAWTLNVTGDVNISSVNRSRTKGIRVNTGTLTCNNISLTSTGGNNNRDANIEITSGTVTVGGNITMSASGRRTYVRFNGNGTLNVAGTISGGNLTSANGGGTTAPTNGTVNYNGGSAQQIGSYTYYNLTTSGGGTKSLVGATTVNNNLTLNSGVLQLGNSDLTIANNANTAIQGAAYNATNMLETNGTGYLIRNAATTLPIDFPIGAGGYYSPASITAISATTGTISLRTEQDFTLGSNFLQKYWDVITSIAGKTITATFNYDPAEIGGTPTDIYVKPNAGVYQTPVGTQSFGTNSFTITGTTDITNTSSNWTAEAFSIVPSDTYFSYQTGNWDVPTTWTSDPGGSTQVGTTIPGDGDVVVILDGRTVSLPLNIDTANMEVNINEGGIIDMAIYSFTAGLKILNGKGTLRLATTNFPTVTTSNTFVEAEGGTTEYYNASDFTLPITQTTYNNLRINAPGIVGTQMNDLTLNGDLHVKQGTFRINDNSSARRQLLIYGDVTVDIGAFISVGTGVTNTTTSPLNINGGTAPFINYYDAQSHRVAVYGDFTNNGTVRFTNLTYPIFNAFPPTTVGATSGFATVYFMGATDNTLTCNNTTDFYNLVLDKGVDQTYKLNIYSTAYPNFRLFGANTSGGEGGGDNPFLKKALWIRTGTLVLKGLTIIPSLSEGACNSGPGGPNSDFYIPANGALILDGSEVVVLSTADDYREVNVAYGVSGGTGLANGVNQGGCSSFSILGKIQINDGYFSTRESGGFITWDWVSGQFVINGGIIDAKQFRSAGGGGGLASFDQSGGTFILRGRFRRTPTAYSTVSNLKDVSISTLNTNRATNATSGTFGTFNINSAANVFTMSGGTIQIYDACGTGGRVFDVLSSTGNINVTGGTVNLIPTTGTGGDAAIHYFRSNAPVANLTINRASSTSTVQLDTYPLVVLNDLNLSSGVLTANNLDVSVQGDFFIANGTTYTPGTNWTVFNGSGSQSFTVNLASTLALKKFKIDKPAGTTLTLAGSQNTISVQDSMMIINGNLADAGKTINFTTSGTTTASYLYNSGIHSGNGRIVMADNDPQIITGDGTGIFQNLELNNTDALATPITLGANTVVNGTLTFSQDKLFGIGTYNLELGAAATIVNGGVNRFVQTDGNAGDGGITKVYSTTATSFTFPMGAPSTSHASIDYTPATLSFSTNPTTYGAITLIPVGFEHPNTTNKGRSLTYFWRVKSSGFTLGSAVVNHSYTYSQNDVVTGGDVSEAEYIAAMYNSTNYLWTKEIAADVNETNNIIGGTGTAYQALNIIDGEFTAGDDNPTDPFGTPTIYYSRQSGLWSSTATWSLTDHLTNNPPAVVPGINDIVIIGGQDSVYLATDDTWPYTTANRDPRSCASLKIEAGSALDIGYNPNSSFGMVLNHANGNGNFRVTTSSTTESTYQFPSGDFSDYNVNLGTTELYSTNPNAGTTYWLPNNVMSYGNLIISPLGGSNIIFPNTDLLIYGNLITRGENSESWFCPTWVDLTYPTAPTVRIAKTITINGDFMIQGGALVWYGNNNLAQDFVILGDLIVSEPSGLQVFSNAANQSISIGGSLINNASAPAWGVNAFRGCDFTDIPLTFFGDNTASITNTTGTPYTILDEVTINKGSSQADSLIIDIDGTLGTLTDNWLTLQNGTLKYSRTNPSSDFTISQGTPFTIPATAGLYIDYPDNASNIDILIANAASNNNDLFLNGKLTIRNGNVYIGRTNGTTNNNNDIEYSGGGAAAIDIQGGNLIVNGQIRRNPATTNGILSFTQSGGDVVINGQADLPGNAKLEICNSGSVFNMSGGVLTIVRGGGTTFGDLYIRAETSTVTGGDIVFTQSPAIGPVVDQVQDYILDANVALNNLTITGKTVGTARNATVTLLISPLTLNGDLMISNARSFFDANTNFDIDVTIKGQFTNNGAYNHYNNLTTFSGGVQTIQGSTATDFYDLLVSPVTSLSLIRDITVYNDLTLSSGQLLGSTYNINVKGDVINNANYDGDAAQGGVILNGTNGIQYISGTGTFGRLEINNYDGARTNSDITLQKNLRLTTGIFDINSHLLNLGVSSNIEGSSFSSSKMIASDGVYSNVGIRKYFGIYSGVSRTFVYPIGTSGKYTRAELTYTDIANVGYIQINNINDNHPGAIDPNNVLDYFWEVESNGITGFNGNLVLYYEESDVQVTGANTEADYIAAGLLIPGTSWTKAAAGSGTDNVDESNNTIIFNYSGSNSLSGEYTAGIDIALPDLVPEFTSINDGDWSDPTNWLQTGGDPYVLTGAPNGFILIIASDDTITTDINYVKSYRITIDGKLKVNTSTFGHNLGTVSGGGIIYLENGTFPAGRYTDFLSCSNDAILEFGGTSNYTLIADLYSIIPRLHFIGSGIRTLPNKDFTICTQLMIDGPTLDNSANNRMITLLGTFERYNSGSFNSGTGAGALVRFSGTSAQTLGGALGDFTGINGFNHFEIDNGSGLTINNGGEVEISGNLLLTNGNINTSSTNKLTITNTNIICVIPTWGSTSSYINGPLIKQINQGDYFVFPIGKDSEIGNKMLISATRTGTLFWTAEYFNPNSTYTSFTTPLTYVNSHEYWNVSANSGSQAIIRLKWDPLSDLTPLMTENGLSDMRVANYNTGTTSWEELASSATGNSSNGMVSTLGRATIPAAGNADYTTSCINITKPRARLNPSGAICGAVGIPVSFSGVDATNLNYELSYLKGGVAQTPVIISSLPYTLPTDATGTTYQLTGLTYNNPPHAGPVVTGVVDATVVTTYTIPTTAVAGGNQSLCGATSTVLTGNTPLVGTGQWSIISGTGGTVVTPTSPTSTFNGTNGTTYTLRWTISNGTCTSTDDVVIAFPLLPVQPGAFTTSTSNVCQGQTAVVYTVPNDPSVTYTWNYTGTGETINGTGNSINVDFDVSATSGSIEVTATNGCSTSAPQSIAVTVSVGATITLGADPAACFGSNSADLSYSATTGTPDQYSIVYSAGAISEGFTDVTNAALGSPISIVVPVAAAVNTYNADLSVRNSTTGCTSSNYAFTVTINPVPTVSIVGADTSCENAIDTYSTAASANTFTWSITSNGTLQTAQGTNSMDIEWGILVPAGTSQSTETVSVIEDDGTCTANDSFDVVIFRVPQTGVNYHISNTHNR